MTKGQSSSLTKPLLSTNYLAGSGTENLRGKDNATSRVTLTEGQTVCFVDLGAPKCWGQLITSRGIPASPTDMRMFSDISVFSRICSQVRAGFRDGQIFVEQMKECMHERMDFLESSISRA